MSVANTLQVNVAAALVASDRLEVRSATCKHLPWLDRHSTVWPSVRAALEAPFREALGHFENGESDVLERAFATANRSLQELLEREFRVVVELKLSLRFEEHAPGVGEAILARLSESTRQKLMEAVTNGQIEWTPFDSVAEEQSEQITRKDFTLSDEGTMLAPGSRASISLKTRRGFMLRGLRVKADECHAEVAESRAIPEGTVEVSLPEISVADYPILRRLRGRVALECFVGSNARAVHAVDLSLRLPIIEQPPLAVFIDMGSTTTKFLTVELSTDPLPEAAPENGWHGQLRRDLNQAISAEGLTSGIASISTPEFTTDFVSARGMPGFDKAKLDALGDEALVAWFESAIRGLTGSVAHGKKRLVSHVYWSFPNTRGRDFAHLNNQLNQRAGRAVFDRIVIVPEHDCLRLRFGGILHLLAKHAQKQQRKRVEAKEHNIDVEAKRADADANYTRDRRAYNKRWAVTRWFTATPERPDTSHFKEKEVPTLAEWERQFRHIEAEDALTELLIIDAGGYSLDVFGLINSQPPFARSFAAGGTRLTDGLREFIAEKDRREIPWNEAEGRKCFLCSTTKPEDEEKWPELRRCRELTSETYDPPLHEIATWIAQRGVSRGIPVILTGGAMANRFLRERIRGILRDHGIRSHATDAVELTALLSDDGPTLGKNAALFNAVSQSFSGQPPVPWYDVLGGLAQHAVGHK